MSPGREQTDWTGRMLGRYRVLAELGSGGMGVVYQAEDTVLQRQVALKTLPLLIAATAADRQRLIGEARAAARISHPHVVTIHDVESSGEIDFLVMELLPLGSLGQWLSQRGPLPWRLATRLVRQACGGLSAAHAAGIVHRDIKPSNLMLSSGATLPATEGAWPDDNSLAVKIADFGISRLAFPPGSATGPITAAGTVHYMSPEQCEGEAEPRSDLYSLGATYFALLTGTPPFVAEHPLQVMFKHCSSPVPDPRQRRPELPEGCTAIIRRAIAKSPAERYADADEMQHDLERLLGGEPLPAPRPKRPRAFAGNRRRAWIGALVALVVAIGIGIGAVAWSQRFGRPTPVAPWPRYIQTAAARPAWNAPGMSLAWRPGFREMAGQIEQVALSSDGRYLACALGDGGGIVLDVEGDEHIRQIETPDGSAHVRCVAFAADPQSVVAGVGALVQVHCFSTGRYERLQTLQGHAAAVAVSTCGHYLAVGEDRGPNTSGRVWLHQIGESPALENLSQTREIEFPYLNGVIVLAFSPDSQQIAAGNEYGSIAVFDVAHAAPLRVLNMPEPQRRGHYGSCLVYSPDSVWLAAAGDRRVVMWNTSTWQERVLDPVHQRPITHLVFSTDGHWLITAASDGLVRWDMATGKANGLPLPLSSPSEVRSLLFVGGEQWLLTGAADKRFLLWNWREAFALAGRRNEVQQELRR